MFQTVYHTVYISPTVCSNQHTTSSTQQLQVVPSSIPHRLHINYSLFQPKYHNLCKSHTACSKQYTTTSTHHLQLVPTSITHFLHITYSLFQPVYHTVYTSPTACSNQYTTSSQLTTFATSYCCNNITLKMAAIAAETYL